MSDSVKPETNNKIPAFIVNAVNAYVKNITVITATSMLVAASAMSGPSKGIIYVVLTILAIFIRIGFLILTSYVGPDKIPEKCEGELPGELQYYDGGRKSIFLLSFTLFYIWLPMLLNKDTKWHLIFMLIVQLALLCFVQYGKECVMNYVVFLCEIVGGAIYGSFVSTIMYYSGLKSWLMLSGIPSEDKIKKSMQSLKCVIKKMV